MAPGRGRDGRRGIGREQLAPYDVEIRDVLVGLALTLLRWTADVVLCTDGPAELSAEDADRLARNGIEVREGRITRLEASEGRLTLVRFEDGDSLARSAMFLIVAAAEGAKAAFGINKQLSEEELR